mmetsp:Transcript_2095/g.4817  ORF Transcript_2095/g.4817 Transcript_2095/m.4817 type:complete len:292 (-) Transcript_2095:1106-1981(-)
MSRRVMNPCTLPKRFVNFRSDRIANRDTPLLHNPLVHVEGPTSKLLDVGHLYSQTARIAANASVVTNLATRFSVKRGLIENDLNFVALVGIPNLGIVLQNTNDPTLASQLREPTKYSGRHTFCQASFEVPCRHVDNIHSRSGDGPGSFHCFLKAGHVHTHALLAGHFLGYLQGKAEGVVKRESVCSADARCLAFPLGGRFGFLYELAEDGLSPAQRCIEPLFLSAHLVQNPLAVLAHFAVTALGHCDGFRSYRGRERRRPPDAEKPPLEHDPPKQPPHDVPSSNVGWHDAV